MGPVFLGDGVTGRPSYILVPTLRRYAERGIITSVSGDICTECTHKGTSVGVDRLGYRKAECNQVWFL